MRRLCMFFFVTAVVLTLFAATVNCLGSSKPYVADDKPWSLHIIDDSSSGADGVRVADVDGDGLEDVTAGWEEGGVSRVYIRPGRPFLKKRWPAVTVGQTKNVEDAVFVDLDGDGAVDVVSSCEGGTKSLFVNWAPAKKYGYMSFIKWETAAIPASEGKQWMFCLPMQVDGVHGVDLVTGGKDDSQVGWFESPANPRSVSDFKYHAICEAGWVMSLIASDMDANGDLDIIVTDRKEGQASARGCHWLENPGPGDAQYQRWKNYLIGGREKEVMFAAVADLDADGLEDIVAAVKPYHILFLRRLDKTGLSWDEYAIATPAKTGTFKAVAVGNIDKDGRDDIVFTCEGAGGRIGVGWLSYKDSPFDTTWTFHDISGDKLGGKYDRIELLDIDGDDDLDVLTTEENEGDGGLGVIWYENPHK